MKKGFTLIELLCVIVILGVILTITVMSVSKTLKTSKNSLSDAQKNNIEKVAEEYYIKEGMTADSEVTCVDVSDLISKGYFDSNQVLDPKTKKEITGSVLININNGKYTYQYQDKSCE